ncbi:MAG: hypothetical protein ONB48_20825 [candidate division KSB1 bacterium]|nr:hypothetical protein [candidate division KSB1 bacterium]MDZ7276423.1 hypothetical protein [candidate division KSB1 bacterium]MDZ7288093.1 hypothetical protein [candidate division KSB1 bacterium]MDZ7300194.1 hypothetical protein [candidate division KSB1 bacterium]MDZ7305765.1 hypothetical protein [candidate division KSB1 bacterium]
MPTTSPADGPRGFTFAEKWIIWSVFCLLLALSTSLWLFPALLLFSWSGARIRALALQHAAWRRYTTPLLTLLLAAALLWWAARGKIPLTF